MRRSITPSTFSADGCSFRQSHRVLCRQIWDFLPDTGPVHYYQEEIMHAAVIGADSFFFFVSPTLPQQPLPSDTPASDVAAQNPWSGYVYGTRALMSDHQLLSDLLLELDTVMGCADRAWVSRGPRSHDVIPP